MTNADCTLYRYNKLTDGYDRFFIPSVYWHETKGDSIGKSGSDNQDSTTVYIFSRCILPETPAKDMLVKGNCSFYFDNTSQKSVSESFQKFRNQHRFVTVMKIADCFFGSLPHCEISAK